MKVSCDNCKHAQKEKGITVLYCDPVDDYCYFCCKIFGIVEIGSECNKIKKKKIEQTFYTSTMKDLN